MWAKYAYRLEASLKIDYHTLVLCAVSHQFMDMFVMCASVLLLDTFSITISWIYHLISLDMQSVRFSNNKFPKQKINKWWRPTSAHL